MLKALWRWLWGPEQPSTAPQEAPGTARELGLHQGRLDTLEKVLSEQGDELRRFRSMFGELQLEWASTLDKLNRWTARESARQRRRFERDSEQLAEDPAEGAPASLAPVGDPRLLSKDQLRAMVMRGQLRPANGAKQ